LGGVGPLGKEEYVEKVAGSVGDASTNREAVIWALDNCYDPCCRDRKISVVDMGLIESISIRGRKVRINMVLTTGWCPFASRLLGIIEEEVGGLPEVDTLEVEIVWDPTWTLGEDERLGTREAPSVTSIFPKTSSRAIATHG
jgi:metal-sulfur cluster biosynthetic enzyme